MSSHTEKGVVCSAIPLAGAGAAAGAETALLLALGVDETGGFDAEEVSEIVFAGGCTGTAGVTAALSGGGFAALGFAVVFTAFFRPIAAPTSAPTHRAASCRSVGAGGDAGAPWTSAPASAPAQPASAPRIAPML